ncbi:MAG: hypothetical protein JSU65_11350 [Candidatus Zixiibacteriota bacterium]|nr:MAG: hypothetical protein JSU65_11350 [candidate division Zixibacteria bacterium]
MPFALKTIDDISQYEQFGSVLIVPCRFCPAASAAVKNNKPYIELFRKFLKTDSYERSIETLKSKLERKGIKTGVFKSRLIHQFVLCMWTSGRREVLKKRAGNYDAIIVLGCEAALQTVRDAVKPNPCAVLQGVETEGIMSIKPVFRFPCNLFLELQSVSRYVYRDVQ